MNTLHLRDGYRTLAALAFLAAVLAAAGCATPPPPPEVALRPEIQLPLSGQEGGVARQLTDRILAHPFPADGEPAPLLVMRGIRGASHSAGAPDLADALKHALTASGKMRFVDQGACAQWLAGEGLRTSPDSEDTAIKVARRFGARYILSGWAAAERPAPDPTGHSEPAHSRFTVEITDATTGLVILRKTAQ